MPYSVHIALVFLISLLSYTSANAQAELQEFNFSVKNVEYQVKGLHLRKNPIENLVSVIGSYVPESEKEGAFIDIDFDRLNERDRILLLTAIEKNPYLKNAVWIVDQVEQRQILDRQRVAVKKRLERRQNPNNLILPIDYKNGRTEQSARAFKIRTAWASAMWFSIHYGVSGDLLTASAGTGLAFIVNYLFIFNPDNVDRVADFIKEKIYRDKRDWPNNQLVRTFYRQVLVLGPWYMLPSTAVYKGIVHRHDLAAYFPDVMTSVANVSAAAASYLLAVMIFREAIDYWINRSKQGDISLNSVDRARLLALHAYWGIVPLHFIFQETRFDVAVITTGAALGAITLFGGKTVIPGIAKTLEGMNRTTVNLKNLVKGALDSYIDFKDKSYLNNPGQGAVRLHGHFFCKSLFQ